MNSRDLQYFLAVAELEHFGKAALKCNVSQPTLSGQIKKLEEHLGVMLFERNNRHVRLTEVGHHIALVARRILMDMDTMRDIAAQHHDPFSGKFTLGAFPTVSTYIFPTLVPKIKKVLPKVRLILQEEKTAVLLDKLKNGAIDAAFLALPIEDDALISQHLSWQSLAFWVR
ncbi:MAG: LysR family transcriptional regulator [Pseudomonadota bacterium]